VATRTIQSEKIEVLLTLTEEQTLEAAATLSNQSISDFVRKAALDLADETLPDRRRFVLDDERWAAFMAALDAPPRDMPRLRRLLNEPSIFSDLETGPST